MTAKTMTVSEKRRHPRIPVDIPLDFRLAGANSSASRCRGAIIDLSQGGMAFNTDALLEEGMTLHLKLPPSIHIRGEVRSVGAPVAGLRRYGVRFHKVDCSPVA